ncbi:MAG: ROK family protein [Chloroflexi bacterium]|nr:ROK family protein [Chloroflexota bacterium]
MEVIVGLDIGGTKTAVLRGTREGRILARSQFPTPQGFAPAFERLCQEVEGHLRTAASLGDGVAAISVSIGGPLDIARGIIYSPPNLPGWDAVPLKDLLAERLQLPVHVEHDGNAGALAEQYFGAGRGFRNIIFLTMGTGLGGGLILDGRLYRGTTDLAGEVGHMRIAPDGPEAYGKRGSWEGFCSGPGMVRLARQLYPGRWPEGVELDGRQLTELAHAADPEALEVVAETGRWLGRGLAVLADILNPEVIVIGSMAVRLGDLLLDPAREEMQREALPGTFRACRVVPAELGEGLGDVAALCAAIQAWHQDG